MPYSPSRLCAGCGQVARGRCPNCASGWEARPSSRRGSTRASRKLRAQVLTEQPICAWPGCRSLATEDDHIIAWSQRGSMSLEQWDHRDNHQGLCATHHDEKTRMEADAARG